MSKRPGEDFDDEDELINAEFESIVAGLSLDESAPTTYLDELDAIEKSERFTPPKIAKRSLKEQFRDAKRAFAKWKDNRGETFPDDGAEL